MPSETAGKVARKIIRARLLLGLSVEDLSDQSRIPIEKILSVEAGNLRGNVIEAIVLARALNADLREVLAPLDDDDIDRLRWNHDVISGMFDAIKKTITEPPDDRH